MSVEKELYARSGSKCETCGVTEGLTVYEVPPISGASADESVLLCQTCMEQIEDPSRTDPNHWRCLNDSMWNENPAVQVVAWRMLHRLRSEGWPMELLEMLYLDEQTLAWAKAVEADVSDTESVTHKDSNGAVLENGDTVVLIKDLNVKGANFTAKRGTAVRGITLVADNAEHIEGRINGQQIVILTKFVKKTG